MRYNRKDIFKIRLVKSNEEILIKNNGYTGKTTRRILKELGYTKEYLDNKRFKKCLLDAKYYWIDEGEKLIIYTEISNIMHKSTSTFETTNRIHYLGNSTLWKYSRYYVVRKILDKIEIHYGEIINYLSQS